MAEATTSAGERPDMTEAPKSLPERRRELLRRRIAASGVAAPAPAEQPSLQAGQRYPLSAGQRRMWFRQTMDAADATLNICVAYRLTGSLDEARLRGSFGETVARHAVLRTTFGTDADGEPYQQFRDDPEIPWHAHDLSGLAERDRKHRLGVLTRHEFGRPFDLTGEAPLRMTLVRTGVNEAVLLFVVHHICWDDDCWDVFFSDLSAAYHGRKPGAAPPQYVAVEALATEADRESDLAYWRNSLRPLPEPLLLAGRAAANPSRRAQRRTRTLPAELFSRVDAFARHHGASPFAVLLAAFGELIRRYTGASDFLIAVPVTERGAAAEGAIGYFGNTLLLRIAPESHHTFTSFLDAVRETCLAGFAHQSVGIDAVVSEINPARTSGGDGLDHLVRLGFSMRKSASGFALGGVLDGVEVRQLESGAVTTQLPLALAIALETDGVLAELEYHTDTLPAALVDQMLTHYLQLLRDAMGEPRRRLASLDMLSARERSRVLAQSHGELVATPATTLVALLESAAAATPDAVAVVSDDAQLSYAQLHQRASRLARRLIRDGIGAEDIVGLRMATSVEFVVATLAVLKAGAAYLPIDPAYPDDRIDYLIADSRPSTVIGRAEFDTAEQAAAQLSDATVTDTDRVRPLRPQNLAYVIYTSGSTGRPKGVAVEHHAIAEHLDGFIAEWSMTAEDRLLQSSSVSFDASVPDMFVTLTIGAALVVPGPDASGDIGHLAELVDRHGVTVLHLVPSALAALLLLPPAPQWRQLRHVPVGGEALPGQVARSFAEHFNAELRNHYGPTEAVVCSTHQSVTGSHPTGVVPIGVPNRNVHAYVLDLQLQPVPAGVAGELYLGGAQLARGYLGRAGLTAERFVADPFSPGLRLYRTGDLVRRNLSGELEFVGRADGQVKIRGFRIELGEVEAVIAAHPAVRHCVVVSDADDTLGPRLAAYLVPAAELDLDEVRAYAAAILPDYMLPSAFAVIAQIPLTVHGKLDTAALPTPTPVAAPGYREPATATEQRICAVFGRLFSRERVGATDSFFALGGHSLLAARLVAQLRAEFGVELTVRSVFDDPTPAGLAARLVRRFRAEFDLDLDALDVMDAEEPVPARPELVASVRPQRIPLSYSQRAAWLQHRLEDAAGERDGFNMPFALRFSGPLDIAVLTGALRDVVACHDALRTTFGEHEGVPYQFVHSALPVDLPIREISGGEVDEAIAELRRAVLTPESGPLIRATLLRVDPNTHVLFVIVHHIVSDHTSLGIIFDDLVVAYRARLGGRAPQWTALPVQFADYALWQRNAFDTPGRWAQDELAYWSDALAGLPDESTIVADRERPPVLGKRGEVANFTLSAAQRSALTRLGEQQDATEFMVYQAVVVALLHKLGAGTDIAVGSPVASRIDSGTANVVGLFANAVVLRTELSDDPSLRTLVVRSRDTVLDAFAHQEVPIERLVDALKPARSRSRNPLYQTMLHFRGKDWVLTPRSLGETGQTTVVPLPVGFDIALLDLDLGLNVTADDGLEVRVVANADLYRPQTVRLIAAALQAALDAFATTPDRSVSALQLLPAADLERVLAPPSSAVTSELRPVTGGSAETERALITVLEQLLEITGVEADDNFFALGGDSIMSIKWSAQATAQGLALTPAMVFEHLTIGELANAVDSASDRPAAPPAVVRHAHEDVLALSPLQEGLFALYRLAEGGVDLYSMQFVIDIDGPVDVDLLRASAAAMLVRYPNLRVAFRDRDGDKPVQVIPAEVELPWSERFGTPTQFESVARSERRRPFDLSRGPALRVALITVPGAEKRRMIFTAHHILVDGWALAVFFTEMLAVYRAGGAADGLAPARPYRDYLVWLEEQDRAAAFERWRAYLRTVSAPLMVADDAVVAGDGVPEKAELLLPEVDTARLRQWATGNGLTLNTAVLFAWAVVLSGITDRRDIVFGTIVSGRPQQLAGVESMVGLFINAVPVVHQLKGGVPVAEQCRQLQTELSVMRDIGYFSLAELQRDRGYGPLFDTMFVFENAPIEDAIRPVTAPDGSRFTPVEMESLTHYPLTVVAHRSGDALVVLIEAIRAVLPHLPPAELGERVLAVLRQLPDSGERSPDTLDILTSAEHDLATWRVPAPEAATVWEMFERQVRATPNAEALRAGSRQRYTYAELHADATRLAQELTTHGVGPETVVALVLPRSPRCVTAILAVLAAGGAYLPVDVGLPPARIASMLHQAGPILAVTEVGCSSLLPSGMPSLLLDDAVVAEHIERLRPVAPAVDRRTEHSAYIIFTSGSTGEAKGVVGTNAALLHYFADHRQRVYRPAAAELGRPLRIAHAWSLSFDASWQPMVGLLDGHGLHLFDAEEMRDADRLVAGMETHRIDMIDTTPSMFVQLAAAGLLRRPPAVLALGGEAIDTVLWQQLREAGPATMVYNCYGPTEATVEAVVAEVAEHPAPAIGRTNAGSLGYALDSALRMVPTGAVGELYLSGGQLARGYVGRPAMTAGHFVADPFRPGQRMYRTGDLVRRLPHSSYAYVGRADSQVKIRGYRVEISEVEAALRARPEVADAAVSVLRREADASVAGLVGFVVWRDDDRDSDRDPIRLRAKLAEQLPDYMVPARIIALPALPVNANGKLDGRGLDQLACDAFAGAGSAVSASTGTERTLGEVFGEQFNGVTPHLDHDFFSLGMDSIVAISVVRAARRRGLTLTPRMVFTAATIRQLAAAVDDAGGDDTAGASNEYGAVPPLPMVSWLQEYGNYRRFTHTVLVRLPDEIDRPALESMLQVLLDSHDTLRSMLADTSEGPRLVTREPGTVRAADLLTYLELSNPAPSELTAEITRYARKANDAMDPHRGVMMQAVWFSGADDGQVLLLTVHHLAVDVVSWHIMLGDLAATWRSEQALPEFTSYRRWSQLMWQRAATPEVAGQLNYWAGQVRESDPALGVRHPDPTRDTWSSLRVTAVTTPADTTRRALAGLTSLIQDTGMREFLLTVTAMAMASWRRLRAQDAASGTLISLEDHGRADSVLDTDTTNTVGWFTTAFPVRLGAGRSPIGVEQAEDDPSAARDLLDSVAADVAAIPYGGVDYGLLHYVKRSPELHSGAEPQIQFGYLGRLDLAGVTDQPWSVLTERYLDALPADPEPDLPLRFALNISALVGTVGTGAQGAQLITNLRWSDALFTGSDIDLLADLWRRGIAALTASLAERGP